MRSRNIKLSRNSELSDSELSFDNKLSSSSELSMNSELSRISEITFAKDLAKRRKLSRQNKMSSLLDRLHDGNSTKKSAKSREGRKRRSAPAYLINFDLPSRLELSLVSSAENEREWKEMRRWDEGRGREEGRGWDDGRGREEGRGWQRRDVEIGNIYMKNLEPSPVELDIRFNI
jgi:hypothetical protein